MKVSMLGELKKIIKISKGPLILKFISSIIIRVFLLVIPIILSTIINYITVNKFKEAIVSSLILIAIVVFYRLSEAINQVLYFNLHTKIYSYYNDLAINKTNDNSLFSLSRFSLGEYTNMVITDVDILTTFIVSNVVRVIQIIEFLVIYIYFYTLDIYLFISAVVLSIIMIFVAVKSGRKVQKLNENRKIELDKMTSSIHDYFLGIKEVKSFNIFDSISKITEEKTSNYLKANSKYNVKFNYNNQMSLCVFEVFRVLSVIYGIYLVSIGNIKVGVVLIIYNYYQKIIDNFSSILTINVEVRNYNVSLKRFYRLLEHSSKRKTKIDNIENVEGNIKFKNILYGYRDNPTLKDISFTINKNSLNVITGKTGKMALGIYDLLLKLNRAHEGVITIDDIDINNISDKGYFKFVSSSSEEPAFFNMSIKDNIGIIEDNYDLLVKTCKDLGIHDTIMGLSKGYDTIMNKTIDLSTLDKQLLSIIRVIVKDSKIMLFDESINSFDKVTLRRIKKKLNELKRDHTILVISHNQDLFDIADNILVMDNKKIVESGSKEELLKNKQLFYRIYENKG